MAAPRGVRGMAGEWMDKRVTTHECRSIGGDLSYEQDPQTVR
jgi:hypothetical protein